MSEIKVGTKLIAVDECLMAGGKKALIVGKEYEVNKLHKNECVFGVKSEVFDKHNFDFEDAYGTIFKIKEQYEVPKHYDNTNGSLYLFAEQHNLNAWEFECIKRIVRSRKKGEFITDIKKSIHVLELYLEEQGSKFKNQIEPLNK